MISYNVCVSSLSLIHAHTHIRTGPFSPSLSLVLSFTRTNTHSHVPLSVYLSLSHTLRSLSLSYTHTHTHTRAHARSVWARDSRLQRLENVFVTPYDTHTLLSDLPLSLLLESATEREREGDGVRRSVLWRERERERDAEESGSSALGDREREGGSERELQRERGGAGEREAQRETRLFVPFSAHVLADAIRLAVLYKFGSVFFLFFFFGIFSPSFYFAFNVSFSFLVFFKPFL